MPSGELDRLVAELPHIRAVRNLSQADIAMLPHVKEMDRQGYLQQQRAQIGQTFTRASNEEIERNRNMIRRAAARKREMKEETRKRSEAVRGDAG